MPRGQYVRRQPVAETSVESKSVRKSTRRQMRLDSALYEDLHKDKKLMKIPDTSVDFHWWLQNGAEPVPRQNERMKQFKGITDKYDSEWVTWPSGTKKDGSVELTYLLMVDPVIYDELITIPNEERQAEITQKMRLGDNASGLEAHLPGGGGIQTYAPNLPIGEGRGFNEVIKRQ